MKSVGELFTINFNKTHIFEEMKKIEYQKPEMEIVKLRGPQVLLETSGETAPDPTEGAEVL